MKLKIALFLLSISTILSAYSVHEFVDIYYDYTNSNNVFGNYISYSQSKYFLTSSIKFGFAKENIKSSIVDYNYIGQLEKRFFKIQTEEVYANYTTMINRHNDLIFSLRTNWMENNFYDWSLSIGLSFRKKYKSFMITPSFIYTKADMSYIQDNEIIDKSANVIQSEILFEKYFRNFSINIQPTFVRRYDDIIQKEKSDIAIDGNINLYIKKFTFYSGVEVGNNFLESTNLNSYLNTSSGKLEQAYIVGFSFQEYQKFMISYKFKYNQFDEYCSRSHLIALNIWL